MEYFRPGTKERDSLTGEVRRPWTARRPLHMPQSSPAVAAMVLPGATATAVTVAVADYQHRRAGGSQQLLWSALASPRAAHKCRLAATAPPRLRSAWAHTLGDHREGKSGVDAADPGSGVGDAVGYSDADVPHELALILREYMGASSVFVCGTAWPSEGMEGSWCSRKVGEEASADAGLGIEG